MLTSFPPKIINKFFKLDVDFVFHFSGSSFLQKYTFLWNYIFSFSFLVFHFNYIFLTDGLGKNKT